ncbi:hypothetical protein [Rhizobium sp.]|uniref:hypothetical protein n=1 Tax=Rhizobium sp. TaxID=391 RepID=UPI0028AE3DB5
MTLSAVLPLIGVFLGWLLGFFTQELNDRKNKHRALGRLLAKLIVLEGQTLIALRTKEFSEKLSSDLVMREEFRASMLQHNYMTGMASYDDLLQLVDDSAAFSPIMAVELQVVLDLMKRNKEAEFKSFTTDPQAYERYVSLFYGGFRLLHKDLRKICSSYALSFSIFTFIGVRWRFHKASRNMRSTDGHLDRMGKDLSRLVLLPNS